MIPQVSEHLTSDLCTYVLNFITFNLWTSESYLKK